MKFFQDSPDIPDELIRSVLNGEAIFLCGAGVSYRAGLPLFKELTEKIYEELGESYHTEGAERHAFERGEYDRCLNALEKRIREPGAPISRVRAETAKLLKPDDNVDLSRHLSLFKLSMDVEGRPRILTTNFDTLFERAAQQASIPYVSHGVKALPKAGGPRDYGVLHLHGRIADTTPGLNLEETELVLTSADFGDAYLRDGWASQYIEDRMRLGPIILVGYGAEDAALRLLLEALDADRERFRDLQLVYALDEKRDGSASLWKAKGIKPVEFGDHDTLYKALAEWARYKEKPIEYAQNNLETILERPPYEVEEHKKGQIPMLLETYGLGRALAEFNPSLAWLPKMKHFHEFKDE